MKITETMVKSALVPSGLPTPDFVLNPYGGCAFGCVYCYADFTRRFQGHIDDKWGKYVDVRVNIADILAKELAILNKKIHEKQIKWKNNRYPIILLSSVTDPYQGVESKYCLTRKCLEVLVEHQFQGEVSILTKSPLVVRDIDLLKQLPRVAVGMTITSTDDQVSRLLEKNAPVASERLKALAQLNKSGLSTYVCVNPLLPHFASNRVHLEKLFKSIQDAGTHEVFIEHLNLSGMKRKRLYEELKEKLPNEILDEFWLSQTDEYKVKLNGIIWDILSELDLRVLGGGILDHQKLKK